ncbi:MAG: energy-coupling factor ABC transporter permease [Nitrospiraceae bacterium]|nr:energy-coupling factor ABC transporter permease [Nitrospiraceae bacterium]
MRFRTRLFSVLFLALFLLPGSAYAMHISEGILPLDWCLLWYAASAPFVLYGLWRLKKLSGADLSFKPLVGLMAAMVFIISAMPIPVPTAGTCSHPCGTGISGILLGPGISILVALVALLLQALFLAHGGISTLGANLFSMGIVGSLTGYVVFKALRGFFRVGLFPAGFAAGLLADWMTYLTTSFELASGIRGHDPFMPLFIKIAVAFVPTQLPLGILEGFGTAGMVILLSRKRPDILVKLNVMKKEGAAA